MLNMSQNPQCNSGSLRETDKYASVKMSLQNPSEIRTVNATAGDAALQAVLP